ncbi:MAG: HAD family hydrolase [Deltaproteobacteria bacterium]|nr:HAD family hydrolase [Deltaproteobacteria bacterium]
MRNERGTFGVIRAVIFDLDGTIIDTLSAYSDALNLALKKFGVEPVEKSELTRLLNRSLPLKEILETISPLFKDQKTNEDCRREILKNYLSIQEEKVTLLPGVLDLFTELKKRGVKIGIVTGRTSKGERKWIELKRLGVNGFIDSFITAAESERKPDASGLLKCLEELGVNAKEAVFVGDSVTDIQTGKNAGIRTVGILTGVASVEEFIAQEPDVVISELIQLLEYVKA